MSKLILLKQRALLLFLPLFLYSCSEVRLIGAYDNKVDDGIQTISKLSSKLLVTMEDFVDKDRNWKYPAFSDNFVEIKSELHALTIRVNGLPKYSIIREQMSLLNKSIQLLEQDYKFGFVKPGITDKEIIKKSIEADFTAIETSITAMLTLQEGLKRKKADK